MRINAYGSTYMVHDETELDRLLRIFAEGRSRRDTLAEIWRRISNRCRWIDGCFVWQGPLDKGFGRTKFKGRMFNNHRVTYEHFHGPIPDGMEIDHVKARGCWSRACCNEAHLEIVTKLENTRRGDGAGMLNARKTHCAKGHLLQHPNLINCLLPRERACRICHEARRARYLAKKKAALAQIRGSGWDAGPGGRVTWAELLLSLAVWGFALIGVVVVCAHARLWYYRWKWRRRG